MKKVLGLLLCGVVLTACTDGSGGSTADRHVTIVNNTGATITRFYGSNAGTSSWQEDILGADVLAPGAQVSINFDDGTGYCTFDFKAVFADGSSTVQTGVDVCTNSVVPING